MDNVIKSLKEQMENINKTNGLSILILCVSFVDAISGFYNGYCGQNGKNKEFYINFVLIWVEQLQSIYIGIVER